MVARFYFEIAAELRGEDEVRRLRDEKIEEWLAVHTTELRLVKDDDPERPA